ncbi:MAG: insulinase family protein [candidate division KSB1 bacterium]|nr:insulinase family protein [candidate division KSB1 bacterium]MDZ7295772.1 insulinase family protein [candidate division KSB1 bacterium]MDZ7386682.1 insulinase family protein [candidate division KSB1 bacterium]MDZ7393867.1 insulinase family protein [candidate division KSB1 bacterium]MDZ7412169.1 insulinase family protein [candidate division KSB1 bacterium]
MRGPIMCVAICSLLGGLTYGVGFAGVFPYAYRTEVLENGLTVVVIPMESPGLVSYYSVVRTGSRDEWEPGHTGFAHFFEHMMFRGTKKYPGNVYDRLMTEMGADANAYTTDDYTCYHINLAKSDLEKVVELESDRFQNLWYDEAAFKTEAGAVHGEYLKSLASPWMVLEETLLATAFTTHTYRHTTIGFREDIEAMPTMYAYSKSFFSRYYRPDNVVLLIAGDVEPEATIALVKKYYGQWQRGYVPPQITPEPEQKEERQARVAYRGKTLPILTVAYKGMAFSPNDVEMAACYLLGDLAFGPTSDIYKKLVIQQQRVEFISADFSANRDPKLLTVYAMVKDANDIENVRDEIFHTIASFQQTPVAQEKLDAQRKHTTYSFLMNLDTPAKVAGSLARFAAMTGGIDCVDQLFATFERVTPEDVQRVAQNYLQSTKRTVVIVTGGE